MSRQRLTQDNFIERAKKVQIEKGREYDYSKVIYIHSNQKIEIVCKKHGPFWQKANSHLIGKGCPECAKENSVMKEVLTTESFIEKAIVVHGDKYDYSKTVYVKAHEKVEIICKEHKSFFQSAGPHLQGKGCHECAKNRLTTLEEFLEKSKLVHSKKGREYDYSNVKYVNAKSKIEIICPVNDHGSFFQCAYHHIQGNGCPKCAEENHVLTTEKFIEKAKEVHKDKYDYSLVEYTKTKNKVKIICPIHKEFTQTPSAHLFGYGCKKCANKQTSKIEKKWLDSLGVPEEFRNYRMKIVDRYFIFDGIDFEKKIIYEFYGNFFHGNPEIYDQDEYCEYLKNTYGYLYKKTIDKENYILENSDFSLVTIWEKDFREKLKNG